MKSFVLVLVCALFVSAFVQAGDSTAKARVGTRSIGKADGVAVWVHPDAPDRSLILGSDPSKGIGSFDLKGRLIEMRNFGGGGSGGIDVRYRFPLGGAETSIVVSGNTKENTLRFFTVDSQTRLLQEVTGARADVGVRAYGSCLYHSALTDKHYVFVTSREGQIEQWEFFDNGKNRVNAKRVRSINILDGDEDSIPDVEACVGDDETGWVYFAQEGETRIWRYAAEPDGGSARTLVDTARLQSEDNVEGLAIYPTGEGEGYLVASIQGSWKYKVYERQGDNRYIGTFDLETADGTGKVQAHDCIAITPRNLGPDFPNGLFVTQNANNASGKHFQLVDWQDIAALLELQVVAAREQQER